MRILRGIASKHSKASVLSSLCVVSMLALVGCGGSNAVVKKPAKLQSLDNSVQLERVWRRDLAAGSERDRARFEPKIVGTTLYTAGQNGDITAVDLKTGDTIWRTDTKTDVLAATGANDQLVVVSAVDAQVIAVSATDGSEQWRAKLSSDSLAPPVIVRDWVLVNTQDGRLQALSAIDGTNLWSVKRSVPRLTLQGNSKPIVVKDVVYTGFDNGRIIATALRDGRTIWEAPVGVPRGRGDLARMVDVDGDPLVKDSDVYAVSFQGRIVSIAAESGRILWTRDLSSVRELSADGDFLYATDFDSNVVAYDRFSSTQLWTQPGFLHRDVTGPVVYSNYVVVGDFQGYLHFLNISDGSLAARFNVGSSAIVVSPKVIDDVLYVQTSNGRIAAYRDPALFAVEDETESSETGAGSFQLRLGE